MTIPKDGVLNKVIIGACLCLISAFLGWGTWVTVVTFDVEDVVACAAENKQKIDKKADDLQQQINIRMNKADAQFVRTNDKLDRIIMKLGNMDKKEK